MARRADRDSAKFLTKCGVLVARWKDRDPAAFGLTELDVDEFEALLIAASQARENAHKTRLLAKARFLRQREAMANLRGRFASLMATIDGRAKREPRGRRAGVYAAAGIDPPDKGGPRPTPAMPSGLKTEIVNNGEIKLTFKMEDEGRGGLLYEVQRRLVPVEGPESPWLPLDITAEKRFTDDDVPTGLREVRYQVRAMRSSGRKGDWSSAHTVWFGTVKSVTGDEDARGEIEPKLKPEPEATAATP
ncbi:MAG: hypothetical protein ACIAS6_01550 [Phycisphaerales bacterium JB060]